MTQKAPCAMCEECPLKAHPFVPSTRPDVEIDLVLIGEAPGATEVVKKAPFVGKSGQLIRDTMRMAGIDIKRVYITNAVLCRPPGNETPDSLSLECCRPRLMAELEAIHPTKILTAGATSLQVLQGRGKKMSVTKVRGQGMMTEIGDQLVYMVPTLHPAAVLRQPDLFRDFAFDVLKVATNDYVLPPPNFDVIIPEKVDDAAEWLDYLLDHATVLSCDIETTGLSPYSNHMYSIGVGAMRDDGSGVSVIIPDTLYEENAIKGRFKRLLGAESCDRDVVYKGRLLFHNAKFDLQFLTLYLGERLFPHDLMDTMLMRYAQDERGSGENRQFRTLGLKDLARTRYDIPDYHFDFNSFNALSREEKPWVEMFTYQAQDCYLTLRVYEDLKRELDEESPALMRLVESVMIPVTKALVDVELHGVLVDKTYLRAQQIQFSIEVRAIGERLERMAFELGWTGTKSWNEEEEKKLRRIEKAKEKASKKGEEYVGPEYVRPEYSEFNPNSPNQVRAVVFDLLKLKTKMGTTEREDLVHLAGTLEKSDPRRGFIESLVDYRLRSRMLSTYIVGLLRRIEPKTGRVHTDFLVHGTDTGRLSSQDPNLQNIPSANVNAEMGDRIKRAFTVPEDSLLLEADLSQIELRVAAYLSRDVKMIEAFRNRTDIHRLVAADAFKKPPESITKAERYIAKYIDFGVLYGRGAKSLTEGFEVEYYVNELGGKRWTLREAQAMIDNFLGGFPQLKSWIEVQHRLVLQRGYVETATGRRRRFPFRSNELKGDIERRAVNTPVQSLAGELTEMAIARLRTSLPKGAHVISTVHDSILFEVKKDALDETVRVIKREMETNLHVPIDIPVLVDIKAGPNWADAHDLEGHDK